MKLCPGNAPASIRANTDCQDACTESGDFRQAVYISSIYVPELPLRNDSNGCGGAEFGLDESEREKNCKALVGREHARDAKVRRANFIKAKVVQNNAPYLCEYELRPSYDHQVGIPRYCTYTRWYCRMDTYDTVRRIN